MLLSVTMQGADDASRDQLAGSSALPPVGAPGEHHRPPQAQRLSHVMTAIGALVLAAIALGVMAIFRTELASMIVLAGVLPLLVVIAALDFTVGNRWEQRFYTYTVTDDFVYITSGRFVRTTTTMPTPHIIAVETQQGPIQRAFGLMSVRFTTITGQQELGPLAPADAERIRDLVTRALHAPGDA
ncbi:PH domain-containing protein [Agrococcus sp. Marseille-P2731]|uniref:PH domain-containing protein n=1 Tax=Agrococcus sp. Marseille-P2731 TaxID=1841862 RepID=UPI0011607D38|nr:PH domain-containing protein [Agrococcus sp. Marseille-P2731]